MIEYDVFVTKYPVYGNLPYDRLTITEKLEEISYSYPVIDSCLPEEMRLYATKLALQHEYLLADCDFQGVLKEVSSRNDTASFVTTKTPYALSSSVPGKKLSDLFKTYGCHFVQSGIVKGCSC
jgi:hypothetical protein